MERAHQALTRADGIGPSVAYEITCDLRRTGWLDQAADTLSWAAPTRAACHGAGILLGEDLSHTREADRASTVDLMRDLLAEARSDYGWEMSEAHRALCLFHTWAREPKPLRRYRWS